MSCRVFLSVNVCNTARQSVELLKMGSDWPCLRDTVPEISSANFRIGSRTNPSRNAILASWQTERKDTV